MLKGKVRESACNGKERRAGRFYYQSCLSFKKSGFPTHFTLTPESGGGQKEKKEYKAARGWDKKEGKRKKQAEEARF